jgi:hypothetical protein
MTLLLRAAGVPARYVEGYVSPISSKNGVYQVTKNQGPAWVEVYSKTLGFYTVETTPGFEYAVKPPYGGVYRPQSRPAAPVQGGTGIVNGTGGAQTLRTDGAATLPAWVRLLLLIPAGLLVALILLLLSKMAYQLIWRIRLSGLDRNRRVILLYGHYLRVLSHLGLARSSNQTPFEFSASIAGRIRFGDHNFDEISGVFLKARFSCSQLDDDEYSRFMAFDRAFTGICRQFTGIVRYLAFV